MKKLGLLVIAVLCIVFSMGNVYSSMATEEEEEERVRVVIDGYEVSGSFVSPGSEFEIQLAIKNTHHDLAAKNVVLALVNNQGIAFPTEGESNQFFIGDIEPDSSCNVTVPIRISETVKNVQDVVFQVALTYSDLYTLMISESAYVAVPLRQECILEMAEFRLADYCYVSEKSVVSSEIKNEGDMDVEEVELHIVLENDSEFIYEMGDIASGMTKYFDHTICMEQAGEQTLTVFMSYKDEMGNEASTERMEYPINVLEGDSGKTELLEDKTEVNQKEFIVKNLVLVFVAILIVVVFHKRDSRKINSRKEVGDGK